MAGFKINLASRRANAVLLASALGLEQRRALSAELASTARPARLWQTAPAATTAQAPARVLHAALARTSPAHRNPPVSLALLVCTAFVVTPLEAWS